MRTIRLVGLTRNTRNGMRGAGAPKDSEIVLALRTALPARRIVAGPLRRLAYATDASLDRLTPEVFGVVESEPDVQAVLRTAPARRRPGGLLPDLRRPHLRRWRAGPTVAAGGRHHADRAHWLRCVPAAGRRAPVLRADARQQGSTQTADRCLMRSPKPCGGPRRRPGRLLCAARPPTTSCAECCTCTGTLWSPAASPAAASASMSGSPHPPSTRTRRATCPQLPEGCCTGAFTNRTCEIGLGDRTGRPCRSIADLLEERRRPDAVDAGC